MSHLKTVPAAVAVEAGAVVGATVRAEPSRHSVPLSARWALAGCHLVECTLAGHLGAPDGLAGETYEPLLLRS
jgi:hypothetical protein